MSRVIKGTRDLKTGQTIMKGAYGGNRRIRCPKCQQNVAIPMQDNNGQNILQCQGCGTTFKSTPM